MNFEEALEIRDRLWEEYLIAEREQARQEVIDSVDYHSEYDNSRSNIVLARSWWKEICEGND